MGSNPTWIKEKVVFKGEEYFDLLLKDIAAAQSSIDLETYIFGKDAVGYRILEALKQASVRGVRVRMIWDGVGSYFWSHYELNQIRERGIALKIYHPWFLLFKINRRNHRKTCLIDQKIAWAGGMNIAESQLSWRDTMVRVEGEQVLLFLEAFEKIWLRWRFYQKKYLKIHRTSLSQVLVRFNDTLLKRRLYYQNFLYSVSHSHQKIWITNPYFVPRKGIIQRLTRAARRGVDVKLLFPEQSDVWFVQWIMHLFYPLLLKAGVKIYKYEPSILHAKTYLMDQTAWVGSTNLNHRSLIHDLEVEVRLTRADSLSHFSGQFLHDLKVSREINLKNCPELTWWQSILARLLFVMRYWL